MTSLKKTTPDPWFATLIEQCLASLYLLSLDGCPAADAVGKAARMWVRMLWEKPRSGWNEQQDDPRIRRAFASIAEKCNRWPSPAVFWEHLPARPDRTWGYGGSLPADWGRERQNEALRCRDAQLRQLGIDPWGEPLNDQAPRETSTSESRS